MSQPIRRRALAALLGVAVALCLAVQVQAQPAPPELSGAVNDFAGIIDAQSTMELEDLSQRLLQATGDVVVVATVKTIAPYADIREYAVKLFENRGRGIGAKGKDNGVLVLVAVDERKVWIETGYGLEEFITDGFAGETSREHMAPAFRSGNYGEGLRRGVGRIVSRIAQGRGVQLDGVPDSTPSQEISIPPSLLFLLFAFLVLIWLANRGGPSRRRRRDYWGTNSWSGWNSGAGSFGGGFGGSGYGGGGFGGGFGGFGGGRSGGGGGGAGW